MSIFEERALRRALGAARRAELENAILEATRRVGGCSAFMVALAEQKNAAAQRRARRRTSTRRAAA